ncbi:MAG: XdhC family protein [Actinobacteria bacterium]|nr:XdhC family protein [Actinomycetota bacterium]MCL6095071.1 XdhC family protein [Actinomycetota bacterium]
MKEVLQDIERWRKAGLRVATARVVGVEGSGPRDPGATMVVNENGEVAGSVSGGCVEGAVVEEAMDSIYNQRPAHVCTFGYSDEQAFAVGLTCGGTLHVLVSPDLPSVYDELREELMASRPVALVTVCGVEPTAPTSVPADVLLSPSNSPSALDGGEVVVGASMLVYEHGQQLGSLGDELLDEVVARDAHGALMNGMSGTRHYGRHGESRQRAVEVFIESFVPPPRMVILGAVDFTAALAKMAKVLGYHVIVCDARKVFATKVRFPMADEVVVDWPDRYINSITPPLSARDAICILTHDPKFDVPAVIASLGTEVGYIGAMGSRRTHEERLAKLREAGVKEEELSRIMAPIGLDIGSRTPEETAVSICAEIIWLRSGARPIASLRDTEGPVHRSTTLIGGSLRP